jgi:hypothetical protein
VQGRAAAEARYRSTNGESDLYAPFNAALVEFIQAGKLEDAKKVLASMPIKEFVILAGRTYQRLNDDQAFWELGKAEFQTCWASLVRLCLDCVGQTAEEKARRAPAFIDHVERKDSQKRELKTLLNHSGESFLEFQPQFWT